MNIFLRKVASEGINNHVEHCIFVPASRVLFSSRCPTFRVSLLSSNFLQASLALANCIGSLDSTQEAENEKKSSQRIEISMISHKRNPVDHPTPTPPRRTFKKQSCFHSGHKESLDQCGLWTCFPRFFGMQVNLGFGWPLLCTMQYISFCQVAQFATLAASAI